MIIKSKWEARKTIVCAPRYSPEEKQLEGRRRMLFKQLDPDYPDAIDFITVTDNDLKILRNRLNKRLSKSGVSCKMMLKEDGFDMWGCRLTKKYTDKYGMNFNPLSDELHKVSYEVGIKDMIEVGVVINEVMDEKELCAVVTNHIEVPLRNIQTVINVRNGNLKYVQTREYPHLEYADVAFLNVGTDPESNMPIFMDDINVNNALGRDKFWKDLENKELLKRLIARDEERSDKIFEVLGIPVLDSEEQAQLDRETRKKLLEAKFKRDYVIASPEDERGERVTREYIERRKSRRVQSD